MVFACADDKSQVSSLRNCIGNSPMGGMEEAGVGQPLSNPNPSNRKERRNMSSDFLWIADDGNGFRGEEGRRYDDSGPKQKLM
ncbi:hypothetical protein CDAR_376801 [Caerostris darwini]|uniref:Uncharacterized protein n=1 Tax=Caerostris darwini TaxID=1538125 RepID=A0AAV4SWK0_9ARAC|nr:hypothetical protein CDAR_376801 [Caerostris darwini]